MSSHLIVIYYLIELTKRILFVVLFEVPGGAVFFVYILQGCWPFKLDEKEGAGKALLMSLIERSNKWPQKKWRQEIYE